MARLYADENFPRSAVEHLRRLGHDVLTAHEAGQANRRVPDREVLTYAIAEERAVLTLDRHDFIRLHRQDERHFGLVVCTDNRDRQAMASCIDQELRGRESLRGALIRVYRPR